MACVMDHSIYITGGIDAFKKISASVYCYNVGDDDWTIEPMLTKPRCNHASCTIGSTLYVFHGLTNTISQQFECLDTKQFGATW